MSMLNPAAPYRRDDRAPLRVPVVMPLVEVVVDVDGLLTVTLDREPYSADGALRREDLRRTLTDIAADLRTPIRVEVREADDSTFTDIITPKQQRDAESAPAARRVLASAFGISGDGFTAGEQVEVCVVVARQVAADDGSTQLRLPPALLASHPDVVLVGRTSGAIALSGGAA
jgi:hypothetical protein